MTFEMDITTSSHNITPTAEKDGGYEHQQMSGALTTEDEDTLPSETSSAAIKDGTTTRTWHKNSLRKARNLSETSLEILERTQPIVSTKLKTSLEALEYAHHEYQINVDPKILTRNDDNSLRKPPSEASVGTPSKIPLPPTSDDVSSTHPSLISLPSSWSDPRGSEKSEILTPLSIKSYDLYSKNNILLSSHFPHLRDVHSSSRHDKASITTFDYAGSVLQDLKYLSIDFKSDNSAQFEDSTSSKLEKCRQFICAVSSLSQVEARMVVVEDLGSNLINLLGSIFNLSPEFFEEHLHRSNYGGFGAQEPLPSSWRTSNLQKNYVSFAWYRPGESWPLGIERGDWEHLLSPHTNYTSMETQCLDKNGQAKKTIHGFVAETNIFRWPVEISTDPAGRLPDKFPCGWQERATLCNVQVNGLHYGAC